MSDLYYAKSGCRVVWYPRDDAAPTPSFFHRLTADVEDAEPGDGDLPEKGQFGLPVPLASDGTSDVVAASWQKDVESPAGSAVIHLKSRGKQTWDKRIRPGDVLVLYMSDADPDLGGHVHETRVAFLWVDRVTKGRVISPRGATVATTVVSARDFGKVLLSTSTVLDPSFVVGREELFYTKALLTALQADVFGFTLSATESVLTLLDLFYNAQSTKSTYVGMQYRFPGSTIPAAALLNFTDVQAPTFGYAPIHTPDVVSAGNMWSLLEKYANTLVNEFFVDVRDYNFASVSYYDLVETVAAAHLPDKTNVGAQKAVRGRVIQNFNDMRSRSVALQDFKAPGSVTTTSSSVPVLSLVLRQRPYDADSFFKLPETLLYSTECSATDLGSADHDVSNFFRFYSPVLSAEATEFAARIRVSPRSIAAFGLRRMDVESAFCFSKRTGENTLTDAYRYYTDLLSTWHAFEERLIAGTIKSRFRPGIRVGTRLVYSVKNRGDSTLDDVHFYVQGLRHDYFFDVGHSQSSFTVTRGMRKDKSLQARCRWTADGPVVPSGTFQTFNHGILEQKRP